MLVYIMARDRNICLRPRADWKTAALAAVAGHPGRFISEMLPEVPQDSALTFMVVVKELVERPPIRYWRSASSLPEERFPLPAHHAKLPSWKDPVEGLPASK